MSDHAHRSRQEFTEQQWREILAEMAARHVDPEKVADFIKERFSMNSYTRGTQGTFLSIEGQHFDAVMKFIKET